MPQTSASAIVISAEGWDTEAWSARVRAADPQQPVFEAPDVPDRAAVGYALVWKPPAGMLATFPNLRVIFSLGAGVDHLHAVRGRIKAPVARVINSDLTMRMVEYVSLCVLYLHRQIGRHIVNQRKRLWPDIT